jgi:NitT/TauT family transport system substrate-binding protein
VAPMEGAPVPVGVVGPTRRQFVHGLVLGGLALFAGGCLPSPSGSPTREAPPATPAVARQPATVRVGQTVALSEAGQFIALDRGYFERQGLRIEFAQFDSAAQMTAPLASGHLDLGTGGVGVALFNALARGIPIRIAGPQARHFPGASAVHLMLRRDLADEGLVQGYADLRGRKVAVNGRGVPPEYGLALALGQAGLQLADVEVVELGFADMVGAFASRAIDAAIQNEPAATQAATRGLALKWHEMGELAPGIQFTVVLYSPEFARQEAARRWMVGYLQGVRDYNDALRKGRGRAEVVDILTRYTPVKDPGLYAQMGFAYIDPDGRIDEPSLAEQLAWYAGQGQIAGPVDLHQAIDTSFADAALQELGAYAG